jgi:hypothetical protein
VDFEVILEAGGEPCDIDVRHDVWTLELLSRTVANPERVPVSAAKAVPRMSASITDSIPFVIITNEVMKPVFQIYADFKTKAGTPAEVRTVSELVAEYPHDSTQNSIRNYIRDCYNNKHTDWVLLGGDVEVIPPVFCWSLGMPVLTDLYYSNLDNEWNEDGDTLFGELQGFGGDLVDYVSDVFVGRLPCSNIAQAAAMLSKIITYQCDTTEIGYQTDALLFGTNIVYGDEVGPEYRQDGYDMLMGVQSQFPPSITSTVYYKEPSATIKAELNQGYGLLVNCSQARWADNFLTHWRNDIWVRDAIYSSFFADSMTNTNRYSVFCNYTCRNNQLEYPEALARYFMRNPHGGGVAYIGSTTYDWSAWSYPDYPEEMFRLIFQEDMAELGKAMAEAKWLLIPQDPWDYGNRRCAVFSFLYLGDPQMRIWTETPKIMTLSFSDTAETGVQNVAVHVTSQGEAVPSALVCLWYDDDLFPQYHLGHTDDSGWIDFNVPFVYEGKASIVATKNNHFVAEDTLVIVTPHSSGGGHGCPTLYVWNGHDYQFLNNILAHSEDVLSNHYQDDAYPVYLAPVVNGRVKVRIQENEKQVSSIQSIAAFSCTYSNSQDIALTDSGVFRILAGDSLLPVCALHNGVTDVTKLVAAQDGMRFSSLVPGHITVKYYDPRRVREKESPAASAAPTRGRGGIIDNPRKKVDPPAKLASSVGDSFAGWNMTHVYALNKDSDWVSVNTTYPRYNKFTRFTELEDYFVGAELTVKLQWTGAFSLDHLPYQYFTEDGLEVFEIAPSAVNHSVAGDVRPLISTANSEKVSLNPGESIDLEFAVTPPRKGESVALVLRVNGRYETQPDSAAKADLVFHQNYPNPFNPSTVFAFSLEATADVSIVIYNILGRQVITLTDRTYTAGTHQVVWDGRSQDGTDVASGVYFASLRSGESIVTRKLMLLR